MKSCALWTVLTLGLGLGGAAAAQPTVPESRVKLIDGHLSSWQTKWGPGSDTQLALWGRDGGWVSGALRWGPVLVGPLRSIREPSVPWDFQPDPSAAPGTWGAVCGAGLPVSCWWIQTPEAVRAGAQGAWTSEAFLTSGGVEWDLIQSRPTFRGLLRLGESAGRGTLWYDGARIGLKAEATQRDVGWSVTWGENLQTTAMDWLLRASLGEVQLEVAGILQDLQMGGRAALSWNHGTTLAEAIFTRGREGPCSLYGRLEGGWGNLVLRGSLQIPLALPAEHGPWTCDLGLSWTLGGSEWSVDVKTDSTLAAQALPSGTLRAAVRTLGSPWKAELELKAPGRVAQWFGAGNQVTLEVSSGL